MSEHSEGTALGSWVAGAVSTFALIFAAYRKVRVTSAEDRAKIAEADTIRAQAEVSAGLIESLYTELKRSNDTNVKMTEMVTKLQEKIQVMSEQMFLLMQQNKVLRHEVANLRQQVQLANDVQSKGPTNT